MAADSDLPFTRIGTSDSEVQRESILLNWRRLLPEDQEGKITYFRKRHIGLHSESKESSTVRQRTQATRLTGISIELVVTHSINITKWKASSKAYLRLVYLEKCNDGVLGSVISGT